MNTKLNGTEMRAEWIAAGGKIHGPNVETVTMPEADYFRFRASLEAAMPHLQRQPAELALDVEAMLTACVPGGSIVDPQVVADNIRAWATERKPAKPEAVRLRDELREREEFEVWASSEISADCRMDSSGQYNSSNTQGQWLAWQAALAATGKQQVGEVRADGHVKGAVLIDGAVHLVQKGEEMEWVRDRGATLLYAIDRSARNG